ncbi:hypothetical protein [Streptomyces cinereoruber]|uniref:hypothetical protein n=1 Tax=Streptomyces cinereoruber TaxID=67260 RepID=UPI003630A32B
MAPQPDHLTATTVEEAFNILDAARKRLEAYMLSLAPGDGMERYRAAKTAPVELDIVINDADLAQKAAERHVFARQMRGGGE